jgi:hypothetical protein
VNHFRDVEESLSDRSDVESQESCRHLVLGDTLIPRSFSSFSAQIKGTDKHTENGYKYGCKYGYKSGGFHVSLLETVYTFQGSDGALLRRPPQKHN